MSLQRTFAIIKPDAMEAGHAGAIISRIHAEGFTVLGMRQVHITQAQAEGFYDIHRGKPFFDELVEFMSRGPIIVLALEAEEAIAKWREVIGATNPAKAADGTIRQLFAKSLGENAVHGSDAPETAAVEIGYFFPGCKVRPSI
ncbi:MAG: nucleoside-diphosphate kinase [Deltaproteobacteria bacterium]|nr:nucleoside-diphosphate kinase [Deltaproteobacteria bacterium]